MQAVLIIGVRHIEGGLGGEIIGIRHQLLFRELLEAGMFQPGLFEVGLGEVDIREGGPVAGLGRLQVGDVGVRLDLEQQIAGVNQLAFLDGQGDDFAGYLGADDDLGDRLDFAGRDDRLRDIAPFYGVGLDDERLFALLPKIPSASGRSQEDEAQNDI